ncbi:uncharacterized protein [Montipora foliosa]|uniref:uncharacterized protein n=1 Tax=Montipora foliosa TaxID=591990 RepID=UPI0035F10B23
MADSSSSSDSSTSGSDLSDFEGAVGEDTMENEVVSFAGIQPWCFEPPGRVVATQEREDDIERPRRRCEEWCLCGNCHKMWREEENVCCREIEEIQRKNLEAVEIEHLGAPPDCIVQHPAFQTVCLNHWVLQAAWLQYKQQYGTSAYEGPDHKKSRHVAYRQLVRWCWRVLGKEIRVPLPSCAVNCIRAHFQEPRRSEDDMVFSGFRYAEIAIDKLEFYFYRVLFSHD